jgi:hypothetical protein
VMSRRPNHQRYSTPTVTVWLVLALVILDLAGLACGGAVTLDEAVGGQQLLWRVWGASQPRPS